MWTLTHELAHIIFQHPKKVLNRKLNAKLNIATHQPWEREANIFAVKMRMPYERVKGCQTAEQIKAISRTSLETSQYRLKEIRVEEARHRAILARGLAPEHFTEEFGHRADLENQVKLLCDAIPEAISKAERLKRGRAIPYKENLFSTAVLITVAADLLFDAYESMGRSTGDEKYKRAATLVAATLFFQPIRRLKRDTPIGPDLVAVNQECAFAAGLVAAGIRPPQRLCGLTSFSLLQEFRERLSFFKSLANVGEHLVKSTGMVISFSNLPDYEEYNRENDILWDAVHEIERIMRKLRDIDYSISSNK